MNIPTQFYQYIMAYKNIKPDNKYVSIFGSYNTFKDDYDNMIDFFSMASPGYKMYVMESSKTTENDIYYNISIFSINDYILLTEYEVEIKRVLVSFNSGDTIITPNNIIEMR